MEIFTRWVLLGILIIIGIVLPPLGLVMLAGFIIWLLVA